MKLNRLETIIVNNGFRSLLQRRIEIPRLLEMGSDRTFERILEVGCGRGVAANALAERFKTAGIDAFDLDERMLQQARLQLANHRQRSCLWRADAEQMPIRSNLYDAVFDFAILHHLFDWRSGLSEIARVLKPGGLFYGEEMLDRFILNPFIRRLLDHPLDDRFDGHQFLGALEETGFVVLDYRNFDGWMLWWAARKERTLNGD